MKTSNLLLPLALTLLCPAHGAAPVEPGRQTIAAPPLRYEVIAQSPRLNRRLMGPITGRVQGVPAEPVDSFVWDGNGSIPIEGELIMEISPETESGFVLATWKDEHGEWMLTQSRFLHPEHSSGVRIGKSVSEIDSLLNEGITHNVYLHGDTTAGQPVLPTTFAYLGIWGPVDVSLDGVPFVNPYELPAPQWLGHLMVTEGVRRVDGSVRTRTGEVYDPSKAAAGGTEPGDLEVHLVFHDERFPRTSNVPPLYSFFYHLVFEDVAIRIVQVDEPVTAGPGADGPPR